MSYRDEVLADSPVAYFSLADGIDVTGNGNDLAVENANPIDLNPADWFAGSQGIEGNSQYANSWPNPASRLSGPFTLETACYYPDVSDSEDADSPISLGDGAYIFSYAANAELWTPESDYSTSDVDLVVGVNHIALTYDGTDLALYINGQLGAARAYNGLSEDSEFNFLASYISSSTEYRDSSSIDAGEHGYDAAVYDKALSAERIAAHADAAQAYSTAESDTGGTDETDEPTTTDPTDTDDTNTTPEYPGLAGIYMESGAVAVWNPVTGEDLTGNGNTATVHDRPGETEVNPAITGLSVRADGNGRYFLTVPDAEQLFDDAFTLEAVVSNRGSQYWPLIGLWGMNGDNEMALFWSNLYVNGSTYNIGNSTYTGSDIILTLTGTYGGQLEAFVDGIRLGGASLSSVSKALQVVIGADSDSPGDSYDSIMPATDSIKLAAFLPSAVTQQEITSRVDFVKAQLADEYLQRGFAEGYMQALDDAEPTYLFNPLDGVDLSGNDRSATRVGTPATASVIDIFSPLTPAKGSGDYYLKRLNVEEAITSEVSLEWVIHRPSSASYCFGIWGMGGENTGVVFANSTYVDGSEPDTPNSQARGYVHLVITAKAGGEFRRYENGQLIVAVDKGAFLENLQIVFGADADPPGDSYDGILSIDHTMCVAAVFDRELTADEVGARSTALAETVREFYKPDSIRRVKGQLARNVRWHPPISYYRLKVQANAGLSGNISGDMVWGGAGLITGVVTEEDIPVRRHVVAFDRRTKLPLTDAWSHPVTGEYTLRGLDPRRQYFLVAFDSQGEFNAVVADYMYPERYQ